MWCEGRARGNKGNAGGGRGGGLEDVIISVRETVGVVHPKGLCV